MAHSREIALQVRTEYLDTMGKIYYSYFKDYYSKLMKLQVKWECAWVGGGVCVGVCIGMFVMECDECI